MGWRKHKGWGRVEVGLYFHCCGARFGLPRTHPRNENTDPLLPGRGVKAAGARLIYLEQVLASKLITKPPKRIRRKEDSGVRPIYLERVELW